MRSYRSRSRVITRAPGALRRTIETTRSTALSSTPTRSVVFRARLRLARGDVGGALEDSARLLEDARAQGDPQVGFPALATRAQVLYEAGEEEEAGAAVDELLARWRESPSSAAGPWVAEIAHVLEGLGRGAELAEATAQVRLRTKWLEAAGLLAGGDAGRAADLYESIGAQPDAARTRLRAAELEIASGRRDEAERQLRSAVEFFRAAGAERYIREVEALLAIS